MRVLIAVTHLLGAGHLMRASAIGRALTERGHEVTLVSGGAPVAVAPIDGLDVVQLPPVRSRVGAFSTLLDLDGEPASPSHLEARRRQLVSAFHRARPDLVVTEHYPFGRRSLQGEFHALLDAAAAARPAPLILGSIRDILVAPAKEEKIARAHALVARRYAAILVHGDEATVPLDRSWPVDAALRAKLVYTGYVGAPVGALPPCRDGGDRTILVSGGSSAAALPLYRAALAAAQAGPERPWRVLVGHGVDEADFQTLVADAPTRATVERARRDFRTILAEASVFVGQAGYNTVMDIVATRARAVLVPFEEGGETEQRLRAESLAQNGLATLLAEEALSPAALLAAIAAAEERARPAFDIALDGQHRSARIVEALLDARHASTPGEAAQ